MKHYLFDEFLAYITWIAGLIFEKLAYEFLPAVESVHIYEHYINCIMYSFITLVISI